MHTPANTYLMEKLHVTLLMGLLSTILGFMILYRNSYANGSACVCVCVCNAGTHLKLFNGNKQAKIFFLSLTVISQSVQTCLLYATVYGGVEMSCEIQQKTAGDIGLLGLNNYVLIVRYVSISIKRHQRGSVIH